MGMMPACPAHQLFCYSNGTTQWVLKNASAFRIQGTYDYEDVGLIPDKMNIKAGAAWLHLADKP